MTRSISLPSGPMTPSIMPIPQPSSDPLVQPAIGEGFIGGPRLAEFDVARALKRIHRAHQHARARLSPHRSEEHTSELQSLMRISYAVFCLKKKKKQINSKQY